MSVVHRYFQENQSPIQITLQVDIVSDKHIPDHPDINSEDRASRREFLTGITSLAAGMVVTRPLAAAVGETTPLPAPKTSMTTVLVTGANRGLGLHFTRQYAERGYRIIATCRNPEQATELNAASAMNSNILVEQLDVIDHGGIDRLAKRYQNMPIDILLNNAGIGGGFDNQLFGRMNYETFYEVMAVNAIGPMKMCEAFREHVKVSKTRKMITVSSSQGSIASVQMPMLYWYRSSKSAVNMLMTNLALQVRGRGIIVGMVTPGATATDFIPEEFRKRIKNIRKPEVAAADMIRNIDRILLDNTGTFFNYDGSIVPW